MAEYIEREAACSAMPDDYYGWRDKQLLKSVPAADVVPVRHGRLLNPNPYGEYSLCGYLIDIRDSYHYCPNCGANMMDMEADNG